MNGRFFSAEVRSRRLLTPGMVRITFGGEGLGGLRSTGVGDEYLRLFFPDPKTGQLALPAISADGDWSYPEGPSKVCCSTYTVRRFDATAGELDIDFVVHAGGTASEWAQRAQPGETITINAPRGCYARPVDARWQLLVSDATGLPAVSRLLEQAPAHVETRVFIEVPTPAHEQVLATGPQVTLTWLHGGNGVARSRLEDVVRRVPLPQTPGYIWAAGEQKVIRAVRRFVRKELQLPAGRYELVGYWIERQHEWDAAWEALDPAIRDSIDAAWASDRDREEVQDEVDAKLETLGL